MYVDICFGFRAMAGYYSIPSLSCFMWGGTLDSPDLFLSYPSISLASPIYDMPIYLYLLSNILFYTFLYLCYTYAYVGKLVKT